MASRIQIRRDTTANWTAEDPVLAQGEFGFDTDTGAVKLGDGATAWSSLAAMTTAGELANYLLKSGGTATNLLLNSYKEQIETSATETLYYADGPWQQLAISANTTITVPDLPTGANFTVDLSGDFSTYSVTFPAGLWQGAAGPPDISAATGPRFLIENRGDTLLLSYMGDYA